MWMARDLIDDHTGTLAPAQLLGYIAAAGALPVLVCCGTESQAGILSLNEVYTETAIGEGRGGLHLSRRSVLVLDAEQLRTLHREGSIRYGGSVVRLIAEVPYAAPGEQHG